MSAVVPAFDPDPDARAADQAARRAEYRFNHNYVSPLAFVHDVPRRDRFPTDVTTLVLGKIIVLLLDLDFLLRRLEGQRLLRFENWVWLPRRAAFDAGDRIILTQIVKAGAAFGTSPLGAPFRLHHGRKRSDS